MFYRVTIFDLKQGKEQHLKVTAVSMAEAAAKAIEAGYQVLKVEKFSEQPVSQRTPHVYTTAPSNTPTSTIDQSTFARIYQWISTPLSLSGGQGKPPIQTTRGIVALASSGILILSLTFVVFAVNANTKGTPTTSKQPTLNSKPFPANSNPPMQATVKQPTVLSSETDQAKSSQRQTTAGHPTKVLAQGIGITYDEVTRGLTDWIPMKKATLPDGRNRYLGTATDKLSMLEVVGERSNIFSATLIIEVPNDANGATLVRQTVTLGIFVKNAMPEWDKCLTEWVIPTTERLGTSESESTQRGNKTIKITKLRKLGWLGITVEPAKARQSRQDASESAITPVDSKPAKAGEPRQEASLTITGQEFLRLKLSELDSFKSNPRFHEMGFAPASPYNPWLKSIEAKRNTADYEKFSLAERAAVTNLLVLGLEYMDTHGNENALTRHHQQGIKKAIDGD